jgi:hypothetical protein
MERQIKQSAAQGQSIICRLVLVRWCPSAPEYCKVCVFLERDVQPPRLHGLRVEYQDGHAPRHPRPRRARREADKAVVASLPQ